MLAHILRPQNYMPSPVTSLCSNNSTIVVFRKNGNVDFLDSFTHKKNLFFNFGYEIKQSFFVDLNNLVALSICGKVLLFDIVTLEKKSLDLNATHVSAQFQDLNFSEIVFHFTNSKNELFLYKNNKIALISALKSNVSCILSVNQYIFIGTCDGWVRILVNGKIETEIELKTKPNSIAMYDANSFIAVADNGVVFLLNPISEIVMDKIEIREYPLNAVAIVNELIHVSGVDPRISCLSLTKNKLMKLFQSDPHYNEVTCMIPDNGKLISSGEDCVVIFSTILLDKYIHKKSYDSSLLVSESKDYCLVAYNNHLDLFSVGGRSKDIVQHDNSFNDLITLKVDEHILERINQHQTQFNHFLRIKSTDRIIAAAISFDQRFVAYSTTKETILYSLFRGSKLYVEKIKNFSPAKKLCFNSKMLIIQDLLKNIKILNLDSFEESELTYDDFRDDIIATDSSIYLTISKQIYNITSESYENFHLDGHIKAVSQIFEYSEDGSAANLSDSIVIISENENDGIIKSIIQGSTIIESKPYIKNDETGPNMLKNILYCAGKDILANGCHLFVVKDVLRTYEIGTLIHGIVIHKGNVIIIQNNYKHIAESFKKCVFKEKYSNK